MLFRSICHPSAKGKPISLSSSNISYNSLPTPWRKQSKPSLRTSCDPWFVIPGLGTFENCKTTLLGASYSPMTACSNHRHSKTGHRWSQSQRLQTRRWKIKCVEKFSQPASAPIGSSEVREEQPPDSG